VHRERLIAGPAATETVLMEAIADAPEPDQHPPVLRVGLALADKEGFR
jgi:hypothetical protein